MDVRIHSNRIEVGRLPGQADGRAQVVYDMVVRISGRAAAEAAGAVKERWNSIEGCRDGSCFGWADDAVWEASYLVPMPRGMAATAVARLTDIWDG
eukprot:4271540-Alexandrium_andersonii.AAC.1